MKTTEKNKLKIEACNKAIEKLQNELKSIGVNVIINECKYITKKEKSMNECKKEIMKTKLCEMFEDICDHCEDAIRCIDNDQKACAGDSIGKIVATIEFCKELFDFNNENQNENENESE